jgi:hypothetical protein
MARTLKFGQNYPSRLSSRIDRMVIRRRTDDSFEAARLAAHIARQVAWEVTPKLAAKPTFTFQPRAAVFGKREG